MAKADDDSHLKRLYCISLAAALRSLRLPRLGYLDRRLREINVMADRRTCSAVLIRVKRATDIRPLDIRCIPSPLFGRTISLLETCDQSPLRGLQLYDQESK